MWFLKPEVERVYLRPIGPIHFYLLGPTQSLSAVSSGFGSSTLVSVGGATPTSPSSVLLFLGDSAPGLWCRWAARRPHLTLLCFCFLEIRLLDSGVGGRRLAPPTSPSSLLLLFLHSGVAGQTFAQPKCRACLLLFPRDSAPRLWCRWATLRAAQVSFFSAFVSYGLGSSTLVLLGSNLARLSVWSAKALVESVAETILRTCIAPAELPDHLHCSLFEATAEERLHGSVTWEFF